jgi:CelD/BcsL family acetyltransferase involved in cellulose biosynthesis
MLHVHRVERLEEFACLRDAWNELLAPGDPWAAFLDHAWFSNWFAAYGAGRAPCVLVASAAGTVHGVLPLVASRGRLGAWPLRCLDLMANGHSPGADLVARPGREADVVAAFARCLQQTEFGWDVATLPEVAPTSRLAALWERFPSELRAAQHQRDAPYIPLAGGWEAFRAGLSRNFQRVLRNNRNRIARAGASEIELLEAPAAIEAALPEVFAIGDKSWQGRAGTAVGSNAANRGFYTGLVPALGARGRLRLWFLRLDGRRVAFELHVVHGGTEFGLKTGYDPEFETVGAGTFLDQNIVERLFADAALREYDLLGNADFYKRRWTPHARPYQRWTLFNGRASGRLASVWETRLKPVLRQARDRGRAAVGSATTAVAEPPEESS